MMGHFDLGAATGNFEPANLIIQIALLVFTGLAMTAAIVQARAAVTARDEAVIAQREAENARSETAALAREANAAFTRSAEAQERANQIALDAIPKPEVRWELVHIDNLRYGVKNIGDVDVEEARLFDGRDNKTANMIIPEFDGTRPLSRGDMLTFIRSERLTAAPPMVRLEFLNPLTGETESWERVVHAVK